MPLAVFLGFRDRSTAADMAESNSGMEEILLVSWSHTADIFLFSINSGRGEAVKQVKPAHWSQNQHTDSKSSTLIPNQQASSSVQQNFAGRGLVFAASFSFYS